MQNMLQLIKIVLVLGLIEGCSTSDIGTMEWKSQTIHYFNKATALFAESDDCLPGFFKMFWENDNCYMFVTTELLRNDAHSFCTEAALGNGLVAIPTELHHAFIVGQIVMQKELRAPAGSYNQYWTSGQNVMDGTWVWTTTAEPFNYTKFWEGTGHSQTGYVTIRDNQALSPSIYYDWYSMADLPA